MIARIPAEHTIGVPIHRRNTMMQGFFFCGEGFNPEKLHQNVGFRGLLGQVIFYFAGLLSTF